MRIVSCPRTHHKVPDLGLNPNCSIRSRASEPWGHRNKEKNFLTLEKWSVSKVNLDEMSLKETSLDKLDFAWNEGINLLTRYMKSKYFVISKALHESCSWNCRKNLTQIRWCLVRLCSFRVTVEVAVSVKCKLQIFTQKNPCSVNWRKYFELLQVNLAMLLRRWEKICTRRCVVQHWALNKVEIIFTLANIQETVRKTCLELQNVQGH